MEQARELDLGVDEMPLELRTVRRADEVFLTNSIIGLWPVVALDGEPIGTGAPGIFARRLQGAIAT
jgi:D-alanine transaminase